VRCRAATRIELWNPGGHGQGRHALGRVRSLLFVL
jgi:hypothetical protein